MTTGIELESAAMGLSNSFVSLGRVIGPIWAGLVFDLDSRYPYLSGAAILLVVFFLSLVWMPKLRQGPAAGSLV